MLNIIIGGFLLSIIHASIPNHWIPLVTISRAEKWSGIETTAVTFIAGSAHTLSSILIGFIVGLIGYKLNELYLTIGSVYAPIVLIAFGLIYLISYYKVKNHHHHHTHPDTKRKSKTAIVLALSLSMFFSPCAEIEAYYFMAGTLGWSGILALSITYFVVTVTAMVIFVYLGLKGIGMLQKRFHILEHFEKLFTGILLIVLGIISLFIKF